MKKLILLLALIMLTVSCKETQKKSRIVRKNNTIEKKITKQENKKEHLLYDIGGTIVDKYTLTDNSKYFLIKLDNGEHIEWETSRMSYSLKDAGDSVHFEYIAKKRYSKKAK